MSAITLGIARTRISGAIGLSNQAGSEEQALMDGWYNEAVEQFLAETKARKKPFTVTLTVDEGDYNLDVAMFSIEELYIEPVSGQSRPLDPVSTSEIQRRRLFQASVADAPMVYALEGDNLLMIEPTPVNADVLKGIYVPAPTAMSSTSHDPETETYGGIHRKFHPTLLAYAMWRAADWDDDTSSKIGQMYKDEWEAGVKSARVKINRKAGRWAPARPGSRHRRNIPSSPGVDTGR